jgi:excisionase family DNA binding protein
MLAVDEVARLLKCSSRHVRRLSDAGQMPRPIRLGGLVRWRAVTGDPATGIRDWLDAGCPRVAPRTGSLR